MDRISYSDERGMVTVITLLVLLAIVALSVTAIVNSRMNAASAENYKNKIQSFYAADGVVTCLAQHMIDSLENNYLVNMMADRDIGTVSAPGAWRYNQFTGTDTVRGGGLDILGRYDDFHYVYRKIGRDADISVRVVSLSNTSPNAAGAIMIRESLASDARCVSVLWPYQNPHNIIFRYRSGTSAQSSDANTESPRQPGVWIRLKRSGQKFTGYRSNDGVSWSMVGSVDIPIADSVYAGLAVCSNNTGLVCEGVFKNLSGLIRRSYTDSLLLPAPGNTWVRYTVDELAQGVFTMDAEGFKKRADRSPIHATRLDQLIYRERTQSFLSDARDSVFLPVTYYDFKADLSNPEFNLTWAGEDMRGMVRSSLDADRKPVPTMNTNLRSCLLYRFSGWGNAWYTFTPAVRSVHLDTIDKHRGWIDTCLLTHAPGYPNHTVNGWWFNDSLRRWFRPSDAPWATFDPTTGRWSNLMNRPRPAGGTYANEWVGKFFNPANPYAAIVFYDSLKFREKPKGSGIFVFGDPAYATTVDTQYFVRQCNMPWVTSTYKFMPLKRRGFGYDPARYTPPDLSCKTDENFAFTMEMHRRFTYKSGQVFSFTGDDDVWVFINDRLVIDLGGIHGAETRSVRLDTLGLTEGEEYWFDFFYCERMVSESNMYVTTNMLMFAPPQQTARNWRRDYGNYD